MKPYLRSPANEALDSRPAKAVKLWRHGLSKTLIAQRLGCSDKSVRNWLIRAGVNSEVRQQWGGDEGGACGSHVPAHIETDWGDRQ